MSFFSKLFNNNNNNDYNNNVNYNNCSSIYLKNNNITLDNLETIFIVDETFIIDRNNCRTIIITGIVEKGHIKIGDTLYYADENLQLIPVNVLGIEKFRQQLSEAYTGDDIGIKVDISKKMPKNLYLFKI